MNGAMVRKCYSSELKQNGIKTVIDILKVLLQKEIYVAIFENFVVHVTRWWCQVMP
jgi:hypothetical protein